MELDAEKIKGWLKEKVYEEAKLYRASYCDDHTRKKLINTIQTSDCRHCISTAVDGDDLAVAFVYASFHNHVDLIRVLLENGINVNVKDLRQDNALTFNTRRNQSRGGVKQDYNEAFKYFKMAADQGHAPALFNLGRCYEYGQGCVANRTEAFKYYQLSADQGYPAAVDKIKLK